LTIKAGVKFSEQSPCGAAGGVRRNLGYNSLKSIVPSGGSVLEGFSVSKTMLPCLQNILYGGLFVRVFISHSSLDKSVYTDELVEKLSERLGDSAVIYDKLTFEAGEKIMDEILRTLKNTDIFVVLLSNHALSSHWVQEELNLAKQSLDNGKLDRIYPIIIDPGLSCNDMRIPEWLKEYNLKLVMNIKKAAKLIVERMKNISWSRHNKIKERANIFVGRNELVNKFEVRVDDFDKPNINTLVISGLPYIGRRSLARHCLVKGNIISETYEFSKISLNRNESVEDFIIKIDDIGINKDVSIEGMGEYSLQEKISIATRLSKQLMDVSECILIYDEGCLINYRGNFSDWFTEIIKDTSLGNKIIYIVITRYKVAFDSIRNAQSAFAMQVPELSIDERKGLLRRLNDIFALQLTRDNMEVILPYLKGYPGQIYYVMDLITEAGVSFLRNNMKKVLDYNEQQVSLLLEKYHDDSRVKYLLALVSRYDVISIDMLQGILRETKEYLEIYERLFQESFFELEGVNGEYIRLNEVVKDYISRIKPDLLPAHSASIERIFREMCSSENTTWYNATDFLLGIRDQIRQGKVVPAQYRIPSVYLKEMIDLYAEMEYENVIRLAKRALENTDNIDVRIVEEIRNRMCLAMAKMKQDECLEEAELLDFENKGFIHAFYYRQIGKNDKALYELERLLKNRASFSQAKREKVLVLTRLQQFEEALILAKENNYLYPDNPYHIQAYFDCLIHTMKHKEDESRKKIQELLERLQRIQSEKAQSMYSRCYALSLAYIEENRERALAQIEDSLESFPKDKVYAMIVKFDIALFFCEKNIMKQTLNDLRSVKANRNTIIVCESKYKALDNIDEARSFFNREIKFFTEESKKEFCDRLVKINRRNI